MFQDPDIKTYGFRKIRTLNRVFQDPDVQGPDFSASGMCVRSAGAQLRHRSCRCAVAAPLPLRRRFWRADGFSRSRLGFSRSRLWRAPRAARGTHRRAKRNGATATARQRRNGNQIMLLAFGAASSSPSTPPPPSPPPAIATAWLQANQGCRQTRRDPSISHAKVLQANQDCRQIRGAQGSYSLPSLQRILQGVQSLPTRVRDGARDGKQRRPVLQYNNICLKQDPSRSRYKKKNRRKPKSGP